MRPPPPPEVLAAAQSAVQRHARTFRWAARFLPTAAQDDAALLYAFCRTVDDAVDEAPSKATAHRQIQAIMRDLEGPGQRPEVAAFLAVADRHGFEPALGLELCRGVASDIGSVRIADDDALIRYAYRVAGTVGLMMLGVLGIRDARARPYALDLGIAMQLTNICRDVAEDARRDRTYLPQTRLVAAGTGGDALAAGSAPPRAVAGVVLDVLDLADEYYESAEQGRGLSPWRSRVAVFVGGRVYRAIGTTLRRRGGDALRGRAVVSTAGTIGWSLAAGLSAAAWATRCGGLSDPGLPGWAPPGAPAAPDGSSRPRSRRASPDGCGALVVEVPVGAGHACEELEPVPRRTEPSADGSVGRLARQNPDAERPQSGRTREQPPRGRGRHLHQIVELEPHAEILAERLPDARTIAAQVRRLPGQMAGDLLGGHPAALNRTVDPFAGDGIHQAGRVTQKQQRAHHEGRARTAHGDGMPYGAADVTRHPECRHLGRQVPTEPGAHVPPAPHADVQVVPLGKEPAEPPGNPAEIEAQHAVPGRRPAGRAKVGFDGHARVQTARDPAQARGRACGAIGRHQHPPVKHRPPGLDADAASLALPPAERRPLEQPDAGRHGVLQQPGVEHAPAGQQRDRARRARFTEGAPPIEEARAIRSVLHHRIQGEREKTRCAAVDPTATRFVPRKLRPIHEGHGETARRTLSGACAPCRPAAHHDHIEGRRHAAPRTAGEC